MADKIRIEEMDAEEIPVAAASVQDLHGSREHPVIVARGHAAVRDDVHVGAVKAEELVPILLSDHENLAPRLNRAGQHRVMRGGDGKAAGGKLGPRGALLAGDQGADAGGGERGK